MTGEPSWRTAVTEAESARRHLAQASQALERLAGEVAALREWGDSMARLAVARRLSEGPDGRALTALLAVSADEASSVSQQATAAALLERLTDVLTDDEIGAMLGQHGDNLEAAARQMIAEVNARGGLDNVSIVLAQTDGRYTRDK